jgi:hypothetical protein
VARVSDFHDQQTIVCKVAWCVGDDPAHEIEPVSAAGEREGRFRSVFGRQLAHRSGGDVRRIRKNQVIAAIGEIVEQVGLYEIDTPLQPIVREVALRDLECRA